MLRIRRDVAIVHEVVDFAHEIRVGRETKVKVRLEEFSALAVLPWTSPVQSRSHGLECRGAEWHSLLMLGKWMFTMRMFDVGRGQSEMNRQLYVHVWALSIEGHMARTVEDGGAGMCLESSRLDCELVLPCKGCEVAPFLHIW